MSHTLNLDQLQFSDYFIHHTVISKTNAVCLFCSAQLFHTVRKRILRQGFDRFNDPGQHGLRQPAQIFPGGLFPLNAKGNRVSCSV